MRLHSAIREFRAGHRRWGPAGLSAAARAAQLGKSYLLLESAQAHANTIQRYQKGKHVMAEPGVVPLRSDLNFSAGTREAVLDNWQQGLAQLGVNVRFGARGNFLDYVSAEQAFMAVQMLVFEIGDADLEAELDQLAASLEDDERYRPAQFARLMRSSVGLD